jgi:uncharacterized protein (DUF1015 family)
LIQVIRVFPFSSLIPSEEMQQSVPTYGSGKLPQTILESLAKENPDSFIRVVKPQYVDASIEQGTDRFYQQSAENLNALINGGKIVKQGPAIYLYEQKQPGARSLRGVVVSVSAASYLGGSVKKHENVLENKCHRLAKHVEALNSVAEPVLLSNKLPAELLDSLHHFELLNPVAKTICAQGFEHTLWGLNDEQSTTVISSLETLDSLYIADGHHRMAAVSEFLLKEGKSDSQGVMSLIMDRDELLIKSFHRLLKNVGDVDVQSHLENSGLSFSQIQLTNDAILAVDTVAILSRQGDYIVGLGDCDPDCDAVGKLEVNRIETTLFPSMFGISDSGKDDRMAFLRGDTPISQIKLMIEQGMYDFAFVLPANSFGQVMEVADQGLTMPPKSTWVEPKLLTGFITQLFD